MKIGIEKSDRITYVSIEGDLYITNLAQFEQSWSEMAEGNPDVVAINCKEVAFIDSSALGSFAQMLKFLMGKNIKLVFYDLSIAVDNIFKLTKLDKFFKVTTLEQLKKEYGVYP